MGNQPIKKLRAGGVEVNIWQGQYGCNITIAKSYKDKAGAWQRTDNLSTADSIVASHLLQTAIIFCVEHDNEARSEQAAPAGSVP